MYRRLTTALLIAATVVGRGAFAADAQPIVLDLKSAMELAIKTSPQIGSANASAEVTLAQVDKAKSASKPAVGLESGYSYLSKETIFGTTPIWEHNTVTNRVGVQQTIYSGGQIQANVNRAHQGYLAAGYGAKAAQADVVTSVAVTYFRAKQAKEAIDVANASVKSLEASHDAAQKLHESVVVTNSDVLRAHVALTSAQESVIRSTNDYNVAIAALRSTIGLPKDAPVELASNVSDTTADVAVKAVPIERPEIVAQAASVQAAEAGKKAARAERLPTVALAADFYNQPAGAQFPRLSNTVLAGIVIKFNALDGGLTRASINEADAAVKKAREDLESEKRRVELEQQAARLDLDSANARVETTMSQVQSAEESLRVLQTGYKEGISTLTDVLSAETALTSARVNRLSALYDVKIAEVNLLRAYGQTDALIR